MEEEGLCTEEWNQELDEPWHSYTAKYLPLSLKNKIKQKFKKKPNQHKNPKKTDKQTKKQTPQPTKKKKSKWKKSEQTNEPTKKPQTKTHHAPSISSSHKARKVLLLSRSPRSATSWQKVISQRRCCSGTLFPTVQRHSKAPAVLCQPRTPGAARLQRGMPGLQVLSRKGQRTRHRLFLSQISSCAN